MPVALPPGPSRTLPEWSAFVWFSARPRVLRSACQHEAVGSVMSDSPVDAFAATARERLRTLTGDPAAEFRDGQLEAIRDLVADRARVLCVQRTGWGKSAVYFVATSLLRDPPVGAAGA